MTKPSEPNLPSIPLSKEFKEYIKPCEFFNQVLNLEQFKTNRQRIYHFINAARPVYRTSDYSKLAKVLEAYLPDFDREEFNDRCGNYIMQPIYIHPDCFTKAVLGIHEEDLTFYKGDKTMYVKREELKFIIAAITKKIWKTKNKQANLAYNYFLKDFAESFKKDTSRSLTRNKLCHIIKLLIKWHFLEGTKEHNGTHLLKIGYENPYYLFACIPDVPQKPFSERLRTEKDRQLQKKDNIISNLVSKNECYVEELRQQKELSGVYNEAKMKLTYQMDERDDKERELKFKNEKLEEKLNKVTNEVSELTEDITVLRQDKKMYTEEFERMFNLLNNIIEYVPANKLIEFKPKFDELAVPIELPDDIYCSNLPPEASD